MCGFSLEQEIIRFKPQKKRIKGGEGGGRWRGKKVVVFCAEREREMGGCRWRGTQKESLKGQFTPKIKKTYFSSNP